jgi:hypothetical protein
MHGYTGAHKNDIGESVYVVRQQAEVKDKLDSTGGGAATDLAAAGDDAALQVGDEEVDTNVEMQAMVAALVGRQRACPQDRTCKDGT